MRFKKQKPFDSNSYLLRSAREIHPGPDWKEQYFLQWLEAYLSPFRNNIFVTLGDDSRIEKVNSAIREINSYLSDQSESQMGSRSKRAALELSLEEKFLDSVLEIFLPRIESSESHLLMSFIAVSTARATMEALTDFGVAEASKCVALGLMGMADFVVFAETDPNLLTSRHASKTGTSAGMAERYGVTAQPYLLLGEKVLNAGSSYFNDGGSYDPSDVNSGDGALIVTDSRLIFVFDEDLHKTPLSISFNNLLDFDLVPTEFVPMSEEFRVSYSASSVKKDVMFFVGRIYAAEIRNLLSRFM